MDKNNKIALGMLALFILGFMGGAVIGYIAGIDKVELKESMSPKNFCSTEPINKVDLYYNLDDNSTYFTLENDTFKGVTLNE